MNAIKTTVQNRRIEVPAPDDLPDGTNVMVDVTPLSAGRRAALYWWRHRGRLLFLLF